MTFLTLYTMLKHVTLYRTSCKKQSYSYSCSYVAAEWTQPSVVALLVLCFSWCPLIAVHPMLARMSDLRTIALKASVVVFFSSLCIICCNFVPYV